MRTTKFARFVRSLSSRWLCGCTAVPAVLLMTSLLSATSANAADLRVMTTGLGVGTIAGPGISCGLGPTDCAETYASSASVTLAAAPGPASVFTGWGGDCSGAALTCTVTMSVARSVRAQFGLSTAIPPLASFTPEGINTYLTANPTVNTAAR